MTAFAGSIGIIGIAAILALANGEQPHQVRRRGHAVGVPLQIQSTGFDMTSMMLGAATGGTGGSEGSSEEKNGGDDSVRVVEMVTNMFSSIGSNDLASLKEYFDMARATSTSTRTPSSTPTTWPRRIQLEHREDPSGQPRQVVLGARPWLHDQLQQPYMSMSMSTDMFSEMPSDPGLYEYQYDVKRRPLAREP